MENLKIFPSNSVKTAENPTRRKLNGLGVIPCQKGFQKKTL